jgi:hypothetical protein
MLVNTFLKSSFTVFFIIISSISIFPENYAPEQDFEPEKITGFIYYLIENREYYRASVEVERLKSYYPDYLKTSEYTASMNYLMYKGEAYELISNWSSDNLKEDPLSEQISLVFKIDSLIKMKKYEEAERIIPSELAGNESFFHGIFSRRKLYFSLMGNRYVDTGNNQYLRENYKELADYADYIHEQKKKPWKGMAAGIIPGMGYIYAGEKGTGITAMIVIGLGSTLTAAFWRSNLEPLGIISGTVTGLFYGGSIIGGYRETSRYNRRLMERLDLKLQRDFDFSRDTDKIFIRFGLKN